MRTQRNHISHKPTTEAEATHTLQDLFYRGVGKKYLGWQIADMVLQDDGSWKKLGDDDWRHWDVPTERESLRKWRPFHEHLKGLNRGVVSKGLLYSPFITVDPDRHHAGIRPKDHVLRVLKIGRLLRKHFPQLVWLVEVNPRNGSTKFFGYGRGPIPIGVAETVAEKIHALLMANGCGEINQRGTKDIEVFPYNCKQVGLPMRTDKVTIVSSGVLGICLRKRRLEKDGPMVEYETYSALQYWQEIHTRAGYDEHTLIEEVKRGCANLPYEPTTQNPAVKSSRRKAKRDEVTFSGSLPKAKGDYRDESNSFVRQLAGLQELCRKLGRVAELHEGLGFIRINQLFSGDWSENEIRREDRVDYLLGWIARTFDPRKCPRSEVPFCLEEIHLGKFDNWCRNFVGKVTGIRRDVDEYGNVVERRGVSVDWKWVSVVLSIVEFCCVTSPNEDGSLPQNRAEDIWTKLQESGRVSVKWDDRKWKTARDWLERRGVIQIVDRTWWYGQGHGQAMKWAVAGDFDRLHVWWKTVRQSSGNEAVPLGVFLRSMMGGAPLKAYPHRAEKISENGRYQLAELASRGPPNGG